MVIGGISGSGPATSAAVGHVVKKVTNEMHIKGHKVAASKDNPEYLVESEKSGGQAAHKPEALRKR
ncbi:MAG: hypothetical protein M1823_007267, partial [Watsoniomyces obsoletus]